MEQIHMSHAMMSHITPRNNERENPRVDFGPVRLYLSQVEELNAWAQYKNMPPKDLAAQVLELWLVEQRRIPR
jgi:hypothetical protein